MAKIIYFTAANLATAAEIADIEALNAIAEKPYDVLVRSATGNHDYGSGPEATDYVAGSPPTGYSETPVIDPDNPPVTNLPADGAVVTNGQTIAVTGGTATITVVDGAVTDIVIA